MTYLPSLRQLRYLVAVADHRHFGRAAAACNVTQPTLSAGIKELEDSLEAALVDRTSRQVVLTPLGRDIAERARLLLHDAEALVRAAKTARAPLTGTVHMGVIPTIGPFLLPRVLPQLRKAYPKLRLFLTEDLTERLVEQLHAGKLDVLLVALPYACGNVESVTLFEDRFSVACPRDSKLATAPSIRPADVPPENLLLLQDGHCLREHALSACRLTDKAHAEAFEATSLHTLVQMVDNGLGITLLPQLAIDAGILRGTRLVVRPLAAKQPSRDIGLVWRRGSGRREEFLLLADELRKRAGVRTDAGAQR